MRQVTADARWLRPHLLLSPALVLTVTAAVIILPIPLLLLCRRGQRGLQLLLEVSVLWGQQADGGTTLTSATSTPHSVDIPLHARGRVKVDHCAHALEVDAARDAKLGVLLPLALLLLLVPRLAALALLAACWLLLLLLLLAGRCMHVVCRYEVVKQALVEGRQDVAAGVDRQLIVHTPQAQPKGLQEQAQAHAVIHPIHKDEHLRHRSGQGAA
jgi:hypothetical protein